MLYIDSWVDNQSKLQSFFNTCICWDCMLIDYRPIYIHVQHSHWMVVIHRGGSSELGVSAALQYMYNNNYYYLQIVLSLFRWHCERTCMWKCPLWYMNYQVHACRWYFLTYAWTICTWLSFSPHHHPPSACVRGYINPPCWLSLVRMKINDNVESLAWG